MTKDTLSQSYCCALDVFQLRSPRAPWKASAEVASRAICVPHNAQLVLCLSELASHDGCYSTGTGPSHRSGTALRLDCVDPGSSPTILQQTAKLHKCRASEPSHQTIRNKTGDA